MRALFTSKNLIGDALYIQPALEEWAKAHPDWGIDLLTNDDHIASLYEGMVPKFQKQEPGWPTSPVYQLVFEPKGSYDFEHVFDVSAAFSLGDKEKIHISTAYAKLLGYDVDPRRVKYTPTAAEDHQKGLILLSMQSNSCASRQGKPPNKMISWAHWLPILNMCRQVSPIGVLGGPQERAKLPVSEDEYYTGLPLEHVARMLRDARLLITIDNGIGHLAASQGTPTILFYPACLGLHWIVPSGNSDLLVCQIDPIAIQPAECQLIVRRGMEKLLKDL
jgi:ADP-heptose:LPS heptosyltransferase